jgi:hypothetical protein
LTTHTLTNQTCRDVTGMEGADSVVLAALIAAERLSKPVTIKRGVTISHMGYARDAAHYGPETALYRLTWG